MSTARLYTVFDYLATLIAERETDQPFMLSQLMNAIQYKFPDFSFEAYEIAGLKEFILAVTGNQRSSRSIRDRGGHVARRGRGVPER